MSPGVRGLDRRRKVGTGFFSLDEAKEIQKAAATATSTGHASLSAAVEHICIDYLNIHRKFDREQIEQLKERTGTDSLCEALSILALQQI